MALDAVSAARARGISGRDDLLTVIDYSLPSTEPRLWVLDLAHGKVLYHELVAHGSGSGDNYATRFSNVDESRQTSLGLFLTGGTYEGGNGYSLKLQGLDRGFNVLIYPEGKLTVGGPLQLFKAGAGLIAVEGGTPIVPVKLRINAMSIIDRPQGITARDLRPGFDVLVNGTFFGAYPAGRPAFVDQRELHSAPLRTRDVATGYRCASL